MMVMLLAGMTLFGCAACGGEEDLSEGAPSYADSKLAFPLYAYSGPTDGTYTENGIRYDTGVDHRTEERYREYADCGFNILLLQGNDPYTGEAFETSQTKKNMDNAAAAGLKVIVFDSRLHALSVQESSLIATEETRSEARIAARTQFESQDALNGYVSDCMKDYANHPAFYGIQLKDEPSHTMFQAMGETYRAIKAAAPNAFVQCNLLPMMANASLLPRYSDLGTDLEQLETYYRAYLEKFLDKSGADYLLYDSYPMLQNDEGTKSIASLHVRGLQLTAEVAKERGVKVYNVAQTVSHAAGGRRSTRKCGKSEMYWQTNLLMGMGVKQISYFTYWRKQDNSAGEYFYDDASIMSQTGQKNALYGYVQTIHREMQKLAPVILNFDWQATSYAVGTPLDFSMNWLSGVENQTLAKVTQHTVRQGGVSLVSELKDSKNGQYGYMIQNLLDPAWAELGGNTVSEITLKFDDAYSKLAVYEKGEVRYVALSAENTYTCKLDAGYAQFVLPY